MASIVDKISLNAISFLQEVNAKMPAFATSRSDHKQEPQPLVLGITSKQHKKLSPYRKPGIESDQARGNAAATGKCK